MAEDANGSGNNAGQDQTTETPDTLHDAAIAAVEAWQAAPTPELKEVAVKATAKAKEAFAADKKAREEATAKSKPPEKYDLKLSEGSRLDAKAVEDVAAFAKSNGLSQDVAKALLEREDTRFAAYVEGQKQTLEAEQKKWVEAVKADKEIGGDNEAKSAEDSKRVLQKFGSEALIKELTDTGLGNHPELVRLLSRIGKAMSEDKLVVAGAQGETTKTDEELFYPKKS